MNILHSIKECIIDGNKNAIQEYIIKAKEEGFSVKRILNEGLISGMDTVGQEWEKGEIFIPEVLISARALNHGLELIQDDLISSGVKHKGTVVIGTVKGDLHDIGKNLVSLMLKGSGYNVIDIGVDCSYDLFIETAVSEKANVIAMSSLLTTTMMYMQTVIDELKEKNLRDQFIVVCGGAPVTETFIREIGADYYTDDAVKLVNLLNEIIK